MYFSQASLTTVCNLCIATYAFFVSNYTIQRKFIVDLDAFTMFSKQYF